MAYPLCQGDTLVMWCYGTNVKVKEVWGVSRPTLGACNSAAVKQEWRYNLPVRGDRRHLHNLLQRVLAAVANHLPGRPKWGRKLRKFEENVRNYRKMRKDWGDVLILPTREWEAGYDHDWQVSLWLTADILVCCLYLYKLIYLMFLLLMHIVNVVIQKQRH